MKEGMNDGAGERYPALEGALSPTTSPLYAEGVAAGGMSLGQQ